MRESLVEEVCRAICWNPPSIIGLEVSFRIVRVDEGLRIVGNQKLSKTKASRWQRVHNAAAVNSRKRSWQARSDRDAAPMPDQYCDRAGGAGEV
jgi:hypothetical protein